MTSLLGDRYRLLGRVAAGGMGEVWRARDELLGREVAVKLLHRHVAADPAFRGRFRTEARIAAGLAAPGIAQVYDYGEADDVAFLVMELVPGESLAAIIARNGALTPGDTLDVVYQTAMALNTAHSAGIIHRDIKPGNLLVTGTGAVKITDFGIARALEAAPVTQTGTILGTAQYVSPEQASGTALTPATDLYSLGVVAYECLAGRPPFTAENQVAIALMHLNEEPPPLPGSVPAPVRELVMACLAKDPARRPSGAPELAERAYALRESLTGAAGTTGAVISAGLGTLTDPAGWRVDPSAVPFSPARPQDPTVPGSVPAMDPGMDPVTGGPAVPRGTAASSGALAAGTGPGRNRTSPAGGTRAARGRRDVRRAGVITAVVAGCAAAVGLGALVVQRMDGPGDARESVRPPASEPPAATSPSATPSRSRPSATRTTVTPTTSPRPTPSPSATVSRSATPSARPTKSPTPSPTPTTPTPTPPPPTVTQTPTPTVTTEPGETVPPDGET
ncbi:serine/threonine-protein kinase [Planomonospora corallina]|uniref:non-specific serine/threonine protein kinase n=1 Tax=Planomonospora corallina TaxID=1806052 RepID=A0ABV8IIZ8_9ACTN